MSERTNTPEPEGPPPGVPPEVWSEFEDWLDDYIEGFEQDILDYFDDQTAAAQDAADAELGDTSEGAKRAWITRKGGAAVEHGGAAPKAKKLPAAAAQRNIAGPRQPAKPQLSPHAEQRGVRHYLMQGTATNAVFRGQLAQQAKALEDDAKIVEKPHPVYAGSKQMADGDPKYAANLRLRAKLSRDVHQAMLSGDPEPLYKALDALAAAGGYGDNRALTIKAVDQAMQKSALPAAMTVHRGTTDMLSEFGGKIPAVGSRVTVPAYMSTSPDRAVAVKFGPNAPAEYRAHPGMIEVELPKGAKAIDMAAYMGATAQGYAQRFKRENEVLVDRGQHYKVVSSRPDYVKLQLVPPTGDQAFAGAADQDEDWAPPADQIFFPVEEDAASDGDTSEGAKRAWITRKGGAAAGSGTSTAKPQAARPAASAPGRVSLGGAKVWSGAQQQSLDRYVNNSDDINTLLKTGKPSEHDRNPAQTRHDIAQIQQSFRPLAEPVAVHRGQTGWQAYANMKPGQVIRRPGFLSTSTKLGTARNYATKPDSMVLHVDLPRGHQALHIPTALNRQDVEGEVLLPHNSRYRVDRTDPATREVWATALGGGDAADDITDDNAFDAEWKEEEHKRGQPGNKGQFASGSGGGAAATTEHEPGEIEFTREAALKARSTILKRRIETATGAEKDRLAEQLKGLEDTIEREAGGGAPPAPKAPPAASGRAAALKAHVTMLNRRIEAATGAEKEQLQKKLASLQDIIKRESEAGPPPAEPPKPPPPPEPVQPVEPPTQPPPQPGPPAERPPAKLDAEVRVMAPPDFGAYAGRRLPKVDFYASDIHPLARVPVLDELEHLTDHYQLQNRLTFRTVAKLGPYQRAGGWFGASQSLGPYHVVMINKEWFGDDFPKMEDRLHQYTSGFHDTMTDPAHVVRHEYGHQIHDEIGTLARARRTNPYGVSEANAAKLKSVATEIDKLAADTWKASLSPDAECVTGYAKTNYREWFAEAFAATKYGDGRAKAAPGVQRLGELLDSYFALKRSP